MSKIVCFGEILVDFMARGSGASLKEAVLFEKFSGGAPANTASTLGRLGMDVVMLGAVGADDFGGFLKNALHASGVRTDYIQSLRDRPTAVVFVALDSLKVPRFHSFGEGVAYNFFKANRKVERLIARSRMFHFSSISLIHASYRREAMKALEAARRAGTWVSFDPNIRLHLFKSPSMAGRLIREVLPFAHILKLGHEEFRLLFGDRDTGRVCQGLERKGVRLILITRGERGSLFYFKGALRRVDAFPVKALDTTGAGDAFMGGVLSRLLSFAGLEEISMDKMGEIVRFGAAVAALSTLKRGATASLPSLTRVRRFLAKQGQA